MINYGCDIWLGYMVSYTSQLYFYMYHGNLDRPIDWGMVINPFSWGLCFCMQTNFEVWVVMASWWHFWNFSDCNKDISFDPSPMLVTICAEFLGWAMMFCLCLKNIILEDCMMISNDNDQFWPGTLFHRSFLSPITDFQLVHFETYTLW